MASNDAVPQSAIRKRAISEQMNSTVEIKVRGYHLDVYGVVNHARYVEFMEECRWRYMELRPELTAALHAQGVAHSVVNLNIDYRRPARLGDLLCFEAGLSRVSKRSITFSQTAYLNNTGLKAVEAMVTNVFFNPRTGRSYPPTARSLPPGTNGNRCSKGGRRLEAHWQAQPANHGPHQRPQPSAGHWGPNPACGPSRVSVAKVANPWLGGLH